MAPSTSSSSQESKDRKNRRKKVNKVSSLSKGPKVTNNTPYSPNRYWPSTTSRVVSAGMKSTSPISSPPQSPFRYSPGRSFNLNHHHHHHRAAMIRAAPTFPPPAGYHHPMQAGGGGGRPKHPITTPNTAVANRMGFPPGDIPKPHHPPAHHQHPMFHHQRRQPFYFYGQQPTFAHPPHHSIYRNPFEKPLPATTAASAHTTSSRSNGNLVPGRSFRNTSITTRSGNKMESSNNSFPTTASSSSSRATMGHTDSTTNSNHRGPILPSFSYPLPPPSMETKQSHRRSSSATNFAGKAGEEVSLDQDFDWGDTDFLSSEAFTKEQNNRTPDRLFKTGEVPTKNMVATSSGGDRSEKKLVITVSTSPTDNLSSPEPTSQERKVSTGSMDLRRNANALDGTRVPTPTPPDTPEDRVNITLDNEEDAANHSHNDSFSLLPDLGREFSNSSARNSPPMMPYMSIGTRPSWEMEEDAEMVELKQGKTESRESQEEGNAEGEDNRDAMQLRSLTPQSEFRMMNEPLSRNATPLLFLPRPQLEEARSNDTLADLPSTPRGSGELSATNLQDRFNNETPTLNNIFKDAASDFSLGFTTSLSNEMGENNVHLSPGQAFVACEMARDKAHTRNTNGGEYREAPPTMITSPNRSPATKFHCSPVPVRQNAACIPSPRSPHYTRSPSTIRAQPFSGPPASLPPSFSELITHWKPVSMERCVPLRSPLPPRFQGNIEQHKDDTLPEFVSLVNYPNSATLRQNKMLPPRMRCCVMCGQIRPTCSRSKGNNNNNMKGPDNISAPNSPRQERNPCVEGDGVTIPLQNKGLCTMCDVNVWVIIRSGMQIKWCKGCKNFRPWAAFTDKGLATKCLRCRERQREKYALLKESKHKKLKKTKSNTLFLEGANHPSIQGSKNWAE